MQFMIKFNLVHALSKTKRQFSILYSLVGVNLIVAGLSFVTTMMVANALGSKTFGDFAFAVAVGTYGQMFIQYGFEKSLVRELVHFPDRFGEITKASLVLRLALFILFLLFIVIVRAATSKHEYSWGMMWVAVATAFTAFQLQGVYDAWNEMRRHAFYLMFEKCIYLALLWIVFLFSIHSLSLELVGLFLMAAAGIGLYLQYKWAMPRINFKSVQGLLPSISFLLRTNSLIWLAVLSGLSIEYFSQIILKWYMGSSELGVYNVAWRITQFSIIFLAQAGRIGAEATARYTRPEISATEQFRFLMKYCALMTVLGCVVGTPFFLFPKYILSFLRPEYANASEVLRLLSIYTLLYGPYLAVLQYTISSRMHKSYFTLITLVGGLSVGLSIILIPQMHSTGAAISVIISISLALFLFFVAIYVRLKNMVNFELLKS